MDDPQDAPTSGTDRWELLSILLADDRFVNQVEVILSERSPQISDNALKNLRRIYRLLTTHLLKKRAEKSSPLVSDVHLRPLEAIREKDICIPHLHLYNEWAKDWLSLFVTSKRSLHVVNLIDVYKYTLAIEADSWANRVRWRFLMLAHYLLRDKVSTDGFTETEKSTLARWRTNGCHYNALCRSLGGYGPLFLLPDYLSEQM